MICSKCGQRPIDCHCSYGRNNPEIIRERLTETIVNMDRTIRKLKQERVSTRQERRFQLILACVASGWADKTAIISFSNDLLVKLEELEADENGEQ